MTVQEGPSGERADNHDDILKSLDEQAREAILYRSRMLHIPGSDDTNKEMDDKAIAVYESAIQRRGAHQAAQDAMQAGIGLPTDAAQRQMKIEANERTNNAAVAQINGLGEQTAILDGRQMTGLDQRIDVSMGDQTQPGFNPAIPDGQGSRIAAMTIASEDFRKAHPQGALTQGNVAKFQAGEYEKTDGEKKREEEAKDVEAKKQADLEKSKGVSDEDRKKAAQDATRAQANREEVQRASVLGNAKMVGGVDQTPVRPGAMAGAGVVDRDAEQRELAANQAAFAKTQGVGTTPEFRQMPSVDREPAPN